MEISRSGSLAVRYRPRRFADVVGQAHVRVPLQRAVATGRLPAQLLFSGNSGLGKTTLARVAAAALLCETPMKERVNGDACGVCESCLMIAAGAHPDVVELDAASHGRVDEIRELASRASLVPLRGTHRVYIVDEAHGLSASGGQAFLKLLEEPPSHVVFMLATTDPDKMLRTTRGRCTEFELTTPTTGEMVANIERIATAEGWALDSATAAEIVAASDPELGVRGTIMSLEKLAGVLSGGDHLDADRAALLLGRPPAAEIAGLDVAIAAGDTTGALRRLSRLTDRFPLRTVVGLLAEAAVDDMVAKVAAGDVPLVEAARVRADAWRAALADGTRAAAIITIVTLTRPESTPEANLALLIERAERLSTQMRSLTADSSIGGHTAGPETIAGPPEEPSDTKSPPDQPATVDVDTFLSRLATISRRARAVVRSGTVSQTPAGFEVSVPNEATRRALEQHMEALRSAASPIAVSVRVSQSRAPDRR